MLDLIIMKNDSKKVKDFIPCWTYFDCLMYRKMRCPAYILKNDKKKFRECSLHIKDTDIGGPELNGPCSECEWNLQYGILSSK